LQNLESKVLRGIDDQHVNRESKVPTIGPQHAYLSKNQKPNSQAPNHGLAQERPRFGGRLDLEQGTGGMDLRPKRKLVVGNWGLTMSGYRRLHFPSQGFKLKRINLTWTLE
jgi:hypothetical protein